LKVGDVPLQNESFEFEAKGNGDFYKIVVKAPDQFANVWLKENNPEQ